MAQDRSGSDDMLTSDGQLDYEAIVSDAVREAMRNVLRTVLTDVAKNGLRGEHHYYIAFDTNAPGVVMSRRLKERYPNEMTIVLQHKFWSLAVMQERFEVKLSFNSIPELLGVPFTAVKMYVDPSTRFGHQFEEPETNTIEPGEDATPAKAGRGGPRVVGGSGVKTDKKRNVTAAKKRAVEPAADLQGEQPGEAIPSQAPAANAQPAPHAVPAAAAQPDPGAKVVSLDQFRKKT
jgi:uncharacterized protein